jgi:Cof subfamily protein (haloacid dehalogenase superfamily)
MMSSLASARPTPAYKVVVSDLDGTLVHHDLRVSDATIQTIRALGQHYPEVKVVLATGRMLPSALPFAQKLGLSTPIITYQGGMVSESVAPYTTLLHQPVPLVLAQTVLRFCKELGLHLNVYMNNVLYTEAHPLYVAMYKATAAIEPQVVANMTEHLTVAPTKLVVIEEDAQKLADFREQVQAAFTEQELTLCLSRPHFLEFTAAGISKWSAVEYLLKHWNLSASEVVAFGDQDNDLSLLRQAGLGVAVGNAPEWIQKQAKRVAPSLEEDGVAKVLQELFPLTVAR